MDGGDERDEKEEGDDDRWIHSGTGRERERMEAVQQQHQWLKMRLLSFKKATIAICIFNLITAIFLFHSFLSPPNSHSALLKYIRESEELRRAMEPVELIKRVEEIEKEAYIEPDTIQQKDAKQTSAVDLIARLNNLHSYSDGGSLKAAEWRKRKMERARQRELGKDSAVQA